MSWRRSALKKNKWSCPTKYSQALALLHFQKCDLWKCKILLWALSSCVHFLHKKVNLHKKFTFLCKKVSKEMVILLTKMYNLHKTYSYYKCYNLKSLKDFENSPTSCIKRYVSCNNILGFWVTFHCARKREKAKLFTEVYIPK